MKKIYKISFLFKSQSLFTHFLIDFTQKMPYSFSMRQNIKNASVSKYERREQMLMEHLRQTNRVTTQEAVKLLDISEATARRFFSSLEMQGKVIRDYGGIRLAARKNHYYFDLLEKVDTEEKKRIGKYAASLIEKGDTVYLDCGTTLLYMAIALTERIKHEDLLPLNIITNSMANIQILSEAPSYKVILTGGVYNPNRRDFSGALTERYISDFHFTKTFFGCDGISLDMGFTSNEMEISRLNACVLACSDHAYVLSASSKFEKKSFISYAELHQIDELITGKKPNRTILGALKSKGLKIHVTEE